MNEPSKTASNDAENNNSGPYQVNQKAWLIWSGIDDCIPIYGETFTALDEDTALELYMALVEEELEETFFWMTQDSLEENSDWEEKARRLLYWGTTYRVLEVIACGNLCC